MSILYSNLKQIGAHPGLGVPVYGIGVAASVPLRIWLEHPISTLIGIGLSAALCSVTEQTLAVGVISSILQVDAKTTRQAMRGLTMVGGGYNVLGGIYSIFTRPITQSAASTPSWSWLFDSKVSLGPVRNSTGFELMFNDKVEVRTIPGFSVFTLDPILRPHVGPGLVQKFVNALIADIGPTQYQGIFFHTHVNGVLFLKLSNVSEVDPCAVASYNVSEWWV